MVARFQANYCDQHQNCDDVGPMDFPPIHYYATLCVACNVEDFLENGEFARWIFTIYRIIKEPGDDMRLTDEFMFWRDWFKALEDGAFEGQRRPTRWPPLASIRPRLTRRSKLRSRP